MNQNQLFGRTRWRLASWYAGVMGIILGLCEFGLYEAVVHAHRVSIERELNSVAGTLHDSLESELKQPGQLNSSAIGLLPDLCLVNRRCSNNADWRPHTVGAITQGDYYVRLLDPTGRLIAVAGVQPEELTITHSEQSWQSLTDEVGTPYRQISLSLQTLDNQSWGQIQVGRSWQDFEDYVATVKWLLLLGWPVAMLLVAGSAWWLAGRAMQPIYQSYGQMQRFTADAAHELRTPLAAIRATVESTLMMPKIEENEARDTLQTIGRQNQRLSHLVAGLLMLCRMDRLTLTGQTSTKQEPVVLNDLVSDVVEEFAALALASKITLNAQIKVSGTLEVLGDAEQLYRLVSNLVNNAIQYTPAGGEVTLILEQERHEALICVCDTGIGISTEEQIQIFERFYRVSSDRSRQTGGSGLGLAIASAIAQAHQGSIQVQSKPGQGSTFTVCLPKVH